MKTAYSLLAACCLLSACSTTPAARQTFLLRSPHTAETRQLQPAEEVSLGSIIVADYIDQTGLVLQLADGSLHTARHAHWAEPLRVSLREFFCAEISARAGYDLADAQKGQRPGQRIDITLSQLHGDAEGNAVLVASWTLQGGPSYQYADRIPLEGTGYQSLAAAQVHLLKHLAIHIAEQLAAKPIAANGVSSLEKTASSAKRRAP